MKSVAAWEILPGGFFSIVLALGGGRDPQWVPLASAQPESHMASLLLCDRLLGDLPV